MAKPSKLKEHGHTLGVTRADTLQSRANGDSHASDAHTRATVSMTPASRQHASDRARSSKCGMRRRSCRSGSKRTAQRPPPMLRLRLDRTTSPPHFPPRPSSAGMPKARLPPLVPPTRPKQPWPHQYRCERCRRILRHHRARQCTARCRFLWGYLWPLSLWLCSPAGCAQITRFEENANVRRLYPNK